MHDAIRVPSSRRLSASNTGAHAGHGGVGDAAPATTATTAPVARARAAAGATGEALHQAEIVLMRRLLIQDVWLFRSVAAGLLLGGASLAYVLWPDIKRQSAEEASEVVTSVLQAEDVQLRASLLAKEVVAQVLNDPGVSALSSSFVQDLVNSPETQALLLRVVSGVLREPNTRREVQGVVSNSAEWLLADGPTRERLLALTQWLIEQPGTQEKLVSLVNSSLFDERFQNASLNALTQVAHRALDDPDIHAHAVSFLRGVLADDALKKTGGDYLWGAYKYSITPRWGGANGGKVAAAVGEMGGKGEGSRERDGHTEQKSAKSLRHKARPPTPCASGTHSEPASAQEAIHSAPPSRAPQLAVAIPVSPVAADSQTTVDFQNEPLTAEKREPVGLSPVPVTVVALPPDIAAVPSSESSAPILTGDSVPIAASQVLSPAQGSEEDSALRVTKPAVPEGSDNGANAATGMTSAAGASAAEKPAALPRDIDLITSALESVTSEEFGARSHELDHSRQNGRGPVAGL